MKTLALEAETEALTAEVLIALCATINKDVVILVKRFKPMSFTLVDEIVKLQVHPSDPC